MPNPKKRHTKTRRDTRRAHDALTPVLPSACPNCQQPKLSHRVCSHCGYYRGVEVIAHRGSSDSVPEHTLAAYRQAIDEGADSLEAARLKTLKMLKRESGG